MRDTDQSFKTAVFEAVKLLVKNHMRPIPHGVDMGV
jgi:hypothetical protein